MAGFLRLAASCVIAVLVLVAVIVAVYFKTLDAVLTFRILVPVSQIALRSLAQIRELHVEKIVHNTLLFLFVLSPGFNFNGVRAEDLPTYPEAVSSYRQNINSGLPLSVEWLVTEYQLPAAFEVDTIGVELLRKAIEAPQNAAVKAALQQKLLNDETKITSDAKDVRMRHVVTRHFLWTDGKRFHYRFGEDPSAVLDTDFGSSLANVTSGKLYSYDPDRVPKLRSWVGYAVDGKTLTAQIGTREIGELTYRSYLPPLGLITEEWKRNRRFSALDQWTDRLSGLQGSATGGVIDGDDTVLIRNSLGDDSNASIGVDRLSAWCAFKKGYIPKRVRFEYSAGPNSITASAEFPSRLRETVDVEGVDEISGMFYPRLITSTIYGVDPKWYAENPGDVDPHASVPFVPMSVRTEQILSVKANRQIPAAWMDLPFPKGTRYMDMDTKEIYLEGVPKAEFDRQLVKELTKGTGADPQYVQLRPRDRQFSWLVALNLGAIVILSIVYVYMRMRRVTQ